MTLESCVALKYEVICYIIQNYSLIAFKITFQNEMS